MDDHRLRTWIHWYRFARQELEYTHAGAIVYANVRAVEEQNRQSAVGREAA
jgi:hypothetical protein